MNKTTQPYYIENRSKQNQVIKKALNSSSAELMVYDDDDDELYDLFYLEV